MDTNQATPTGAVIVTGASSGIGEACALYLDKLGFRVFAGVRQQADGEALKRKASDRLTPVRIDVTEPGTIASAAETVAAGLNGAGLAGLVNNAGIAVPGPLEFLPMAELRQQFEVNVFGLLSVTQAFLPLLRKARGRIINIGSISGRSATPFVGAYASSKFALEALTDSLRVELLPWGISVSIVEPGSIATPIWEKSGAKAGEIARNLPPQARELYGRAYAAMREATQRTAQAAIPPERVARTVAHALTAKRPKTRYLVGKDAQIRALLQHLPDRMRDRLIMRRMGLPR